MIIDGLPPGTTIELTPLYAGFVCETPGCGVPGGNLGGEIERFTAPLAFQLRGTGALGGFRRIIRLPTQAETHSAPRTPGDPVQNFDTDMFNLLGGIFGDPDFAILQLVAGTSNGLPSPGHTTLTDRGDGTFLVDSFFDVTYRIDFVGAPGGALEGLSGSTAGSTRVSAVARPLPAIEPDNGTGTVTLPPANSQYESLHDDLMIIDGLPPGTTIELEPRLHSFICTPTGQCGNPGGSLGGQVENYQATLGLELAGTGTLAGYRRSIPLPVAVETHSGPRTPAAPVQSFSTDLYHLGGSLFGDPDFDQLQIVAGTVNGLPGPGHTVFTVQGDGTFLVDSFFDVTYRIDFVGAPGGALDGLSGSTTGSASLTVFHDPYAPPIVDFDAGAYTIAEDALSAPITVTLNRSVAFTASVDYAASAGSAAASADFLAASGTLTFTPGITSQLFTVSILDDQLDEKDETVLLALSNANRALIGAGTPVTLTIIDDDPPPVVSFSSLTYATTEDIGTVPITVTLDAVSGLTVTTAFSTASASAVAGSDYLTASGTLTFAPGVILQSFPVTVLDDEVAEPSETITLTLGQPANARLGEPPSATLTILDDDYPYATYLPLVARPQP